MRRPLVVIVTGPPGAGKTTLGRRLAQEIGLPFINKDDIKEILFDTLGWQDRQWSMRLGHASFGLLYHILKCQLRAGQSAVVETAFIPKYDNERFLNFKEEYDFETVQILCHAEEKVLFERFLERTRSEERHPGHADHLTTYEQFIELLRDRNYAALEIDSAVIDIDTTDFDTVDFEGLVRHIKTTYALTESDC